MALTIDGFSRNCIKYSFLILLIFTIVKNVHCQTTILTIVEQHPESCRSNQYYDISHLRCLDCPDGGVRSDSYNCRCNQTSRFTLNNGGGNIRCTACPTDFEQSSDGWYCLKCANCSSCDNKTSIYSESDLVGNLYVDQSTNDTQKVCLKCSPNTWATSAGCQPCYNSIFSGTNSIDPTTVDCSCARSEGGICLNVTITDNYDATVPFGSNSPSSWYFQNYLKTSAEQCRLKDDRARNATGCQILGNLCTLLQFSLNSINFDACKAFNKIFTSETSTWLVDRPWLYYDVSYGTYKTNAATSTSIFLSYQGQKKCQSTSLSFLAAKYSLSGKLLSFETLDMSELQLCYNSNQYGSTQFIYSNYQKSCTISIANLLKKSTEPVFYDIYFKYTTFNNGSVSLLPVPVIVTNYKDATGTLVNQIDSATNQPGSSARMNRRLYLVDTVSGQSTRGSPPAYIRYMSKLFLQFELLTDSTTGQIYPPVFYATYDFVSVTSSSLNNTITTSFEVNYKMNLDSQTRDIWIAVGVLSFFGILWSIIRIWIWNKRAGKQTVDLITIFKFLMFFCSSVGNVFFVVLIGISIWWLIFFKGQDLAYIFLPTVAQISTYQALVIVAFALKLIDILHIVFTQVSINVFLIDWEKPKVQENAKGTVSCWRTLFVANEWSEIQNYRILSTNVQLFFVLLFLKVVNLEAITTADCNVSVTPSTTDSTSPYNSLLRIGMAASMYLLIGIAQWIIYRFIYTRFIEDKLTQFVDLCSVANISVFIMSHDLYGYYIHGRSPNGIADTNMLQMYVALEKESHDLVPKRGLSSDSKDQTFSMSLPDKLSKHYGKVMAPLSERRALRPNEESKKIFSKYTDAYNSLNNFLMSFIDHGLRDISYRIVERNFIENLLDVELKDPYLEGYFYSDHSNSFDHVLFAGKERQLFTFELILFLFVDFFATNYVLAAFFVFLVSKVFSIMRADLAKRNLSKKTMVDQRFLI